MQVKLVTLLIVLLSSSIVHGEDKFDFVFSFGDGKATVGISQSGLIGFMHPGDSYFSSTRSLDGRINFVELAPQVS